MGKGFTDIFIKRPVFATVISLALLIIGLRAYFALPIRQYPTIEASVVSITVSYPGASADLMESFVTTPLENAISGVEGIDYISSTSSNSHSGISVYFKLGFNVDRAIADLNSHISAARWRLPPDIKDPIIKKEDPNTQWLMFISFDSDTMTPEQVTDYLLRIVQPKIQSLPGVGNALIMGERQYAMRIWLDPQRMTAHNVTANDVEQALTTKNIQMPAGRIEGQLQTFNVETIASLANAKQFNDLIIKKTNNKLIRIQDIGRAELGPEDTNFSVIMNDKNTIPIAITVKPNANPLSVSQEINQAFPTIAHNLPAGLHGKILWDGAEPIRKSISEVKRTIIEAIIFVLAIIFLFLGSARILLIPAVTIPLSLIGVCTISLIMGHSINTLTLLAMVLAVGMVVDDAIVVSENIHRHTALGQTPFNAALIGAREIQFAVIAMTLTLAAVYAPIGFTTGLTGALFKEFAVTLASAVIISGFIALTLSPMMCSKIMTAKILHGKFPALTNTITNKIKAGYTRLLQKALKIRLTIVPFLILVLIGCVWLYKYTPQELAPKEDEGAIMAMVQAPSAANLAYIEKYTNQLTDIYHDIPETKGYGIINGMPNPQSAFSFIALKDWSERKRSVDQIINQSLMPKLFMIPGVQVFAFNPSSLPGAGFGMPIQMVLQTTASYQELNAATQKFQEALRNNPALVNLNSDLKIDRPQLNIEVARDKAGDLGIPLLNISNAVNLALGTPTITHFTLAGRSYDVLPQLMPQFRNRPDAIKNLTVRSAAGDLIPLANLINIKEVVRPESLNHFQQLRSATISGSMLPNYSLGQALSYMQQIAYKVLPKNIQVDFVGESRQFLEAQGKMLITFLLAIIFIYLVLAAQFESFLSPLIVMFSVPLSTIGALITLRIIGGTMNIYSEIGLVTLVGLISKHGILMVEFANQLQAQGKTKLDAIVTAASIRLRPILMTTCAIILGATPLVLASGAGAISRHTMGWIIIGGMSIGTLFTLFVIPTMYTYLTRENLFSNLT